MRYSIKRLVVAAALVLASRASGAEILAPTLKIAAEERYDDNLLLRTEAGNGQLVTKLSPQVGLTLKDETLTSSAWYAADLLAYGARGNVNLDHRGHLDLKKLLTRRLRVDADLGIWRVTDPTSLPRLGLARTLAPVLYGTANLAGQYELSEQWTGRVGYRFEGARIYDAQQPYGGTMHAPYAELLYNATRRTSLGARYRFQYFGFGPESADANTVLAEYVYRLSPLTAFTARVGPAWYRPHGPEGAAGVLPVVDLELAREVGIFQLGAAAGHDLVGATGFTPAVWADYASLMANYRVLPRVSLFGAVSYYRNGMAPDFQFNPFAGARAANGYAVEAGAEWRITRAVAVQGVFNRYAQLGGPEGIPGADLAWNIAAVRLSVTAW